MAHAARQPGRTGRVGIVLSSMGFGRRFRKLMYLRVALLAAVLVAVLVFHAHGSTLAVFQVVRIALLVLILLAVARRRTRWRR